MPTTAEAEVQAEIEAWLDQYTAALEDLKGEAAAAAEAAWLSFRGWYQTAAVASVAADMADLSLSAQQTVVGMSAQYVENILGLLYGTPPRLPAPPPPSIRNGADLKLVHMRPAESYRRAVATGHAEVEAAEIMRQRATGLMLTDLSLVSRETERDHYRAAGIRGYRRVIRPELSKSGSCGLCVVASDRIYSIEDLLPIHPPHCKCVTLPIQGDVDPGLRINNKDLKAIYEAAGDSTKASDLKGVRVKFNEHGELGPVLNRKGDRFRGPDSVALEDDPARALRMLDKIRPVLADFERRTAAGEDVSGPLTYQRNLVARLERIAA